MASRAAFGPRAVIWRHRRSQGGKRSMPPKFSESIVILCFERRFSKQNRVIRLKSNIFGAPKFLGWPRHCLESSGLDQHGSVLRCCGSVVYINQFCTLTRELFTNLIRSVINVECNNRITSGKDCKATVLGAQEVLQHLTAVVLKVLTPQYPEDDFSQIWIPLFNSLMTKNSKK